MCKRLSWGLAPDSRPHRLFQRLIYKLCIIKVKLWFIKCQILYFKNHVNQSGQLILRRIVKIVATKYRILRPKCTKIDFGQGSAPDPAGRA